MGHLCGVDECKVILPTSVLMCAYHWGIVPEAVQAGVWLAYKEAKSAGRGLASDPAYLAAVDVARRAVMEALTRPQSSAWVPRSEPPADPARAQAIQFALFILDEVAPALPAAPVRGTTAKVGKASKVRGWAGVMS